MLVLGLGVFWLATMAKYDTFFFFKISVTLHSDRMRSSSPSNTSFCSVYVRPAILPELFCFDSCLTADDAMGVSLYVCEEVGVKIDFYVETHQLKSLYCNII